MHCRLRREWFSPLCVRARVFETRLQKSSARNLRTLLSLLIDVLGLVAKKYV
jgi:hypothetical protein